MSSKPFIGANIYKKDAKGEITDNGATFSIPLISIEEGTEITPDWEAKVNEKLEADREKYRSEELTELVTAYVKDGNLYIEAKEHEIDGDSINAYLARAERVVSAVNSNYGRIVTEANTKKNALENKLNSALKKIREF